MSGIAFWPAEASAVAGRVDAIVIALLVISTAIVLLVGGLVLGFSIRYRRGSSARRGQLPELVQKEVEVGWISATLFLALFLFGWASITALSTDRQRPGALEIHVEARQWMWKARHPNGAREINALHLPLGEPVRLVMQSQDVIHSFFVPAFRKKQDVLPGRITQLDLEPTREGEFPLYCAEYCGTLHARMGGKIVVMKPEDYARWSAAQPQEDDQSKEGAELFRTVGCSGCHAPASPVHAPELAGLYGRMVNLADGRVVRADEAYLRDSILQPRRDIAAGYAPIMPTFAGILGEDDLQKILAYLMSLRRGGDS